MKSAYKTSSQLSQEELRQVKKQNGVDHVTKSVYQIVI